jgi:hypothetical protein
MELIFGSSYIYKGNKYILQSEVEVKHPDSGDWFLAVEYICYNKQKSYVREIADFKLKFKKYYPNQV